MQFTSSDEKYQGRLGDLKTFFIEDEDKRFICYRVSNRHDKPIYCWGEFMSEAKALSMIAYTLAGCEESLDYIHEAIQEASYVK